MAHSMTRRTLREHCFKLLFCTDFYPPEEAEEQIEDYFRSEKEEETDESGSTEILHLVDMLGEVSEGWSLRRMGKVELTVLRLAAYEIRFDDAVPEKVAINEAVELARKFGGDESPVFVNGILAKLV